MSNVIVKKSSALEYVIATGGFTTDISKAQVFADVTAAKCTLESGLKFGISLVTVAAPVNKSFAVGYVRKTDLNADGSIKNNTKNPSRRRFATLAEAQQHGSRFMVRKAKGSKVAGSAGHIGYYTVETNDAVNASVNATTGLTNKL